MRACMRLCVRERQNFHTNKPGLVYGTSSIQDYVFTAFAWPWASYINYEVHKVAMYTPHLRIEVW